MADLTEDRHRRLFELVRQHMTPKGARQLSAERLANDAVAAEEFLASAQDSWNLPPATGRCARKWRSASEAGRYDEFFRTVGA